MPGHDTESQFKFLIACIKHSASGKVDFGKVAEELDIVSKGAAAKRYERLMKAHGISSSGNPRNGSSPAPSGLSNPTPSRKIAANKKRKTAHPSDDADDDEYIKAEPKKEEIKREMEDYVASDGSYMTNPGRESNPTPPLATAAAASTLVAMAGDTGPGNDDDVYLICATEKGNTSAEPPVDCTHRVTTLADQYSRVIHHVHVDQDSRSAVANAGMLNTYDCGANWPSQTSDNNNRPIAIDGQSWFNPSRLRYFLE
ncbi:hypothetical protein NKR23_g3919 [Pleurostoma richardsiae]|uniref:Myb-like DNA-binding domain-containing protein n=1 Tax=Pleurostoma richardsiae TaxID=41990 RepID=A0AA38S376_9PEZI|nr:hypothetical protein NKR23_g3919 [Pleurostoma richardsiae]